jgi:hypothetical protein
LSTQPASRFRGTTGAEKRKDGTLVPRYSIMAIAAAHEGTVYVTTLAPLTLHAIRLKR